MSSGVPSGVSRLFHLKGWVELFEATSYLSAALGEEIGRDDVLRLAMDDHLTLSVRLISGTPVKRGSAVPLSQATRREVPTLDGEGVFVLLDGTVIPGKEQVIVWEDRINTVTGVWDLPMFGGEALDVENLYEKFRCREPPELLSLEGAFLTDSQGVYCQLVERFDRPAKEGTAAAKDRYHPDNFYPSAGLPEDSHFVVRTAELRRFVASLQQAPADVATKPLERRERTTLLVMIAALAELAKIDVNKPSSAATAIESQTALMGARIAARTIEGHLNKISEALESRAPT